MVKRNKIIFTVLIFISLQINVHAYLSQTVIKNNNIIEEMEFGEINWTQGKITISGNEKLVEIIKDKNDLRYQENPTKYAFDLAEARKITKLNSLKKTEKYLYNALLFVRIKNNTYLKNYLLSSTNDFKFHFNNFIEQNQEIQYIYNEDNSITTSLSLDLYGPKGLIQLFLNDESFRKLNFQKQTNYQKPTANTNEIIPQVYTSLIIDASEIKMLKPALFPIIYNQLHQIIYTPNLIINTSSKYMNYAAEISNIKDIDFVDDKSYIIKAISSYNETDLVLPLREAMQFLSDKNTLTYLKKCNIIIIFPKPRG